MSTTNAHEIHECNLCRSREDPTLSHEGPIGTSSVEQKARLRNKQDVNKYASPLLGRGFVDISLTVFRSLTFCSTEAGRSAWYPERAAPILVKATRVRTWGCLIPAVWLAVTPVSKPDCTYTIPESIEAQFEAQRSTGVSGHSRSPNQLRNVHRYATSVVHSIRIGVETLTVPL
jgi:hypothetical protein